MQKPKNRHKALWPMTPVGSIALVIAIFVLLILAYYLKPGLGS